MTSKSEKVYYDWLGELSRHGWNADKQDAIKFNAGGAGETAKHIHAKTACARVLKKNGYRIGSEVKHAEYGECDVIAVPTRDDQRPFVCELETSPTEEVVNDKVERYAGEHSPFVECWVINVSELPLNILEMEAQIAAELGMEI